MKRTLKQIALTGVLTFSLVSCSDNPQVKEAKDLTGDGIYDVLLNDPIGNANRTYLFVGKGDGSFIKMRTILKNSDVLPRLKSWAS